MSNRVALITGITGQDGAYLADFLLARGYIQPARWGAAQDGGHLLCRIARLEGAHAPPLGPGRDLPVVR
jgi:hypothetical protein